MDWTGPGQTGPQGTGRVQQQDSDVGDFLRAGTEHWLKMRWVLGIAAGVKGLGGPQFSMNGSQPRPPATATLSADGHARR